MGSAEPAYSFKSDAVVTGRSLFTDAAELDEAGIVDEDVDATDVASCRWGVCAGDGWEECGKGSRSLLEGVPYILAALAALKDMEGKK